MEHWLEWVHPMKDRSDDPSHHERTLLPQSYISLLAMRNTSMGPPPEGSIRQPITPWANALTTELHLAPCNGSTPWRIDPMTHRAMSERSYHGAISRSWSVKSWHVWSCIWTFFFNFRSAIMQERSLRITGGTTPSTKPRRASTLSPPRWARQGQGQGCPKGN